MAAGLAVVKFIEEEDLKQTQKLSAIISVKDSKNYKKNTKLSATFAEWV